MILSCQNISKAFVENQVLKNISFHIEDYEKAAIVGINGAGKTTLLRILMGEITPDEGTVVLAKDKKVGYLAQNSTVDSERTIYDELLSVKQELIHLEEKMRECEINMKHVEGDELEALMKQYASYTQAFEQNNGYAYKSELTGVLKGLGFTEEDFHKKISTLSGGQKTRVALGRLLLLSPDLIILDEPTNHLDIQSKEILETALNNYSGTVLYVSHDRYFINKTATRILDLTSRQLLNYIGNYDYYLEKKETVETALLQVKTEKTLEKTSVSETKADWKSQKEEQAKLRKRENDLKKCEDEISVLEEKQKELEDKMSLPEIATNSVKLQEVAAEQSKISARLEELYELWETLA